MQGETLKEITTFNVILNLHVFFLRF